MNRKDNFWVDSFEVNFSRFRDDEVPIALYGIGPKTQLVLENIKGFNIVGLMDKDTVGKVIYGHSVLSYEEVINKVKLVIILANMSVTDLIYHRIAFLENHGIKILCMNGSEPTTSVSYLKNDIYFNNCKKTLMMQIDAHDIISFDLFDTLIMRRVLLPSDIFDLVEDKLICRYGSSFDFKTKRIRAEHYCYNEVSEYFNIIDIYNYLQNQMNVTSSFAETILEIELFLERDNCIPRNTVVDVMRYAISKGKHVCITTDTYLKEEHIISLMKLSEITNYDMLFISCEIKQSKANGSMWQYLKNKYNDQKVLHIGDNYISDIENAQKAGIDAYEVKSAFELIGISSVNHMRNYVDSFENRLLLGQLSTHMLNDPFAFHETRGQFKVNTMHELGFLSFGPLVLNFLLWLIRKSKEHKIEKLLFFSRDGYLLERLYQQIVTKFEIEAPTGKYLLTSRRAASVASIYSNDDIEFIINWMCNTKKTTVKQILQVAFGVDPVNDDIFLDYSLFEISKEQIVTYVIQNYSKHILENSKVERENYHQYIRTLELSADDKIGCVNYVGRGFTQRCFSNVIGRELYGYYFATENDICEIMPSLDTIFALYGNLMHPDMERSAFKSKFLFGEVILSSPDNQLVKFDQKGQPVFQCDKKARNFFPIGECHQGITKYVDEMLDIDVRLQERCFDTKIIESYYELFLSQACILSENVRSSFLFSDYYNHSQMDICLLPAKLRENRSNCTR